MTFALARRHLLPAALVAVVLAVLGAVAVPGQAEASTTTTMEWQFFSKLNSYRSHHGKAALRMSTRAVEVARDWSSTMARANWLYHNPQMVRDLERIAPRYRTVGENVGYGWSVSSLHDAFAASAEHRANMLDSRYDYVGIGVVVSAGDKIWVTFDFIDTTDSLRYNTAPGSTSPSSSTSTEPVSTTAAPAPLASNLYTRNRSGRTVRSSYSASKVRAVENLGGRTGSAPATTTYGSKTAVAVRGTDNRVWLRTGTPGHFSGWHSLGGKTYHGPALVGDSSGRLDVFVTGTNRALFVRSYVPGDGWTGWRSLGGILSTGPGAVLADGSADVFAAGTDRAVWARSRTRGHWGRWHSLGGRTPSAPAASYDASRGHEIVAVRGTNNAVYVREVGRSGWKSLGGRTYSGPGTAMSGSSIAVAVRGTDNRVYSRTLAGSWSSRWVRG